MPHEGSGSLVVGLPRITGNAGADGDKAAQLSDVPPSTPRLVDDPGLEVVAAAVLQAVCGRMLPGQHECARGAQHTPQLRQSRHTIVQVLDREGEENPIDSGTPHTGGS
jgi:hypothetical protein